MSPIARIVIDAAIGREFDYAIPDELQGSISLGSRVVVPFGRSVRNGYVVDVADQSSYPKLKSIESLADDKPLLNAKVLELARWIAQYYCATVEQVIRTVLPAAVRRSGPLRDDGPPGCCGILPKKISRSCSACRWRASPVCDPRLV